MLRKLTLALCFAATPAAAQQTLPAANAAVVAGLTNRPISANGLISVLQGMNGFTDSVRASALQRSGDAMSGMLEIVPPGTTPQGPGNAGLLKLTSPYGSLNAIQETFRATIGNCPASMGFANQPTGKTNATTSAIVGCTAVPAGSYNGDFTWPDVGVSGYANVYSANKSGIAVGGFAGIGVTGGFVEGWNGVVGNAPTGAQSVDGQGFDFSHIYGIESDNNLFKLPSGVAPTGDVVGVLSFISGSLNSTGPQSAFAARQQGVSKWNFAYTSDNGAAATYAIVGAKSAVGPADGQPILFKCISGTGIIGAGGNDLLCGQMYGVADGTLHLTAPAGLALDAPVQIRSTAGVPTASISPAGINLQTGAYQEVLTTPPSSSASCTAGQFTDDANYHYVCTATNTWKRVALSAF